MLVAGEGPERKARFAATRGQLARPSSVASATRALHDTDTGAVDALSLMAFSDTGLG